MYLRRPFICTCVQAGLLPEHGQAVRVAHLGQVIRNHAVQGPAAQGRLIARRGPQLQDLAALQLRQQLRTQLALGRGGEGEGVLLCVCVCVCVGWRH